MGFPELIHAIGEQSVQQREAILSKAREEAAAIVRQAEARLPQALQEAKTGAEAGARQEASRIVSRARLEARRTVRDARRIVVGRAIGVLEARLAGLPSTPGYREVLACLLGECLAELDGTATVRCRREDRALVEEEARTRGRTVTVEAADLPWGGVEVAAGPEGRHVSRNGFADRMESVRPLILQEAGRLLFPPSGGETGP